MDLSKLDLDMVKEMQDEFFKAVKFPMTLIDLKGNEIIVSGKYPFFYEMLKKKDPAFFARKRLNKLYENMDKLYFFVDYDKGLSAVIFPVRLFDKVIGALVMDCLKVEDSIELKNLSKIFCIDEDELSYAYEEMDKITEKDIELGIRTVSIFVKKMFKISYMKYRYEKKISDLTTLSELVKLVNSSLDLEKVLRYVMNFMVNNLKANDCSIVVDNEGVDKRFLLKDNQKNLDIIEKALRNKVNETKEYIVADNLSSNFGISLEDSYDSVLCLPLKVQKQIVGTLNVYSKRFGEIDHYDFEFLTTVSDQAALAVINASKFEEVKELAVVDKLTGAYNRRHFMSLLDSQLEKSEGVSLILIDIDDFGKYNNTHGHPQGDELLRELTKILKDKVRSCDSVGRYGGEEFIILLPGLKSSEASEITKRLKEAVENNNFKGGESQPQGKVTISLGLVTSLDNSVSLRDLIKEADDALYKAKKSGKNRFVHTVMIKSNLKADTFVGR